MGGRGKSTKVLEIIAGLINFYAENHPATVRAACYWLFIHKLIDSMSKNNTSRISHILARAREEGLVPWDHVVDETREAETIASWSSPDQLIRAAVGQYRKDYWAMQPHRVEVWSEKGTIRGTVAPVLKSTALPSA